MNLSINLENIDTIKGICGANNQNIKLIEELYNIKLELLSDEIIVSSNDDIILKPLEKMFNILLFMLDNQYTISSRDIIYIKNLLDEGKGIYATPYIKRRKCLKEIFLVRLFILKLLSKENILIPFKTMILSLVWDQPVLVKPI